MSETVAVPSALYDECAKKWRLPRTLMGGTPAMRRAGKIYLPQDEQEPDIAYRNRLERSFLFNGYRKTVRDMAGKVFAKPVALGDDVPAQIAGWAENIDMTGRHLSNFAYDVFTDGVQTGVSFILADMPPAVEGGTRADDLTRRPYLAHVSAEQLIGWKSENIDGREVLTQARIHETVCENDPEDEFAEVSVEQVRVFDRVQTDEGPVVFWRVFRKVKQKDRRRKDEWVLHADGRTSLPEITLVPFYAARTGYMTGEPPLEDLAFTNLAHWQSASDQRSILHIVRVAMLFAKGFRENDQIAIGPNTFTRASDVQADLKFVEHTGKGVEAGRNDLQDLEFQMQTLGLELLIPQPGNQSATGAAIDQAKMNSPLGMMADNLKDALEQAFVWLAQYAGIGDNGGSLTVNTDFGVTMRDAADLQTLLNAVNANKISKETFWKELQRRGVLMDDFVPEDEAERLEENALSFGLGHLADLEGDPEEDEEAA